MKRLLLTATVTTALLACLCIAIIAGSHARPGGHVFATWLTQSGAVELTIWNGTLLYEHWREDANISAERIRHRSLLGVTWNTIEDAGFRKTLVYLPLWLPGLLFAATFGLLVQKCCRRPLPGLCPNCGYDLRATPHRCPECGQETPKQSSQDE